MTFISVLFCLFVFWVAPKTVWVFVAIAVLMVLCGKNKAPANTDKQDAIKAKAALDDRKMRLAEYKAWEKVRVGPEPIIGAVNEPVDYQGTHDRIARDVARGQLAFIAVFVCVLALIIYLMV